MTEGSVRRLEWTRMRVPPGSRAGGTTRAYLNHGRWIADCRQPYCNGAELLEPRQFQFHCTNCHWEAPVQWPADADAIWEVLAARPVPGTRNWFPSGHELALRSGCPHGQTVADLVAENAEYMDNPTILAARRAGHAGSAGAG